MGNEKNPKEAGGTGEVLPPLKKIGSIEGVDIYDNEEMATRSLREEGSESLEDLWRTGKIKSIGGVDVYDNFSKEDMQDFLIDRKLESLHYFENATFKDGSGNDWTVYRLPGAFLIYSPLDGGPETFLVPIPKPTKD